MNKSVGGIYFKFFVFYTVLLMLILSFIDIIPKEGQLIPRDGEWRPATTSDRIRSFLIVAFWCYSLGFLAIYMTIRLSRVLSDGLFSGNPGYNSWRSSGGDPFVDGLGFPLNNQPRSERVLNRPTSCCRCGSLLTGMNGHECQQCGMVWCDNMWWEPPKN